MSWKLDVILPKKLILTLKGYVHGEIVVMVGESIRAEVRVRRVRDTNYREKRKAHKL